MAPDDAPARRTLSCCVALRGIGDLPYPLVGHARQQGALRKATMVGSCVSIISPATGEGCQEGVSMCPRMYFKGAPSLQVARLCVSVCTKRPACASSHRGVLSIFGTKTASCYIPPTPSWNIRTFGLARRRRFMLSGLLMLAHVPAMLKGTAKLGSRFARSKVAMQQVAASSAAASAAAAAPAAPAPTPSPNPTPNPDQDDSDVALAYQDLIKRFLGEECELRFLSPKKNPNLVS